MKGLLLLTALTLVSYSSVARDTGADSRLKISEQISDGSAAIEEVRSIPYFGRLHSWQPVDERTLIIWANAFDPYLVELAIPVHGIRLAHAVGVTAFGSRVHARFDSVQIDGIRYPISRIYQISRQQARDGSFVW